MKLDSALTRPSASDVAINFHMLRSIVAFSPEKAHVSSREWGIALFFVEHAFFIFREADPCRYRQDTS